MVIFIFTSRASAQVLKRLGDRAKQKLEQKAGDKTDKTIDDVTDNKSKTKTPTDKSEAKEKKEENETETKTEGNTNKEQSLQAYSKYDFVPGEKIVAYEDFARVDVGDFPTNWNTNASAEAVTLNNREGKWLKINKQGVWMPEFINSLPENFTLEFDLGIGPDADAYPFVVNIGNLADKEKDFKDFYHYMVWNHGHALRMTFDAYNGRASGEATIQTSTDGNYQINNSASVTNWDNTKNNFAHISLWRQKQRLRIYLNGQKLFDLPKAFDVNSKYNTITFAAQEGSSENDYYLLGNIRLAVGAPDTRNKLLTEGKFVTTGILFDVNSDKLKPESFGVLKEIAGVLSENPDVKVKIIGHTDSDGDDAKNLDLSKRRAASVKNALASEFKIDASRMETDGMGETKPVADNKTAEGKAQNRRVEFVKL